MPESDISKVLISPPEIRALLERGEPVTAVDARGRIGMWGDEAEALLPGQRAGAMSGDTAGGRTGAAMKLAAQPSSWCGARVVMAMLPPGITAYRFTGWSRAENGTAQIRVLWLDAAENIVGTDVIPVAGQEAAWQRHEGSQSCQEVERFEHYMRRAVAIRRFQLHADVAALGQRQPLD